MSVVIDKAVLERAGALYAPVLAGLTAWLTRRPRPRQFAGCLLSVLWAMTTLLALQNLNESAGWWSFARSDVAFRRMPLELYLGWIVLWGVIPQLVFPRLKLVWVALTMAVVDLIAMPLCGAVLRLGPRWLIGEGVAIVLVLLPALAIARWTVEGAHLRARTAMQVATSGMLFLFWVPEMVFALRPGRGWGPLLGMPGWAREVAVQIICVLALPGVAAVMEFAQRGWGTPIPYDPPKRLVTSGVYRYCANPMQMSCGVVMLAWAGVVRNGWLVLGAVISVVYSAGIAAWDEGADLDRRFGAAWLEYRAEVKSWRVRWRPYSAGAPAEICIARTCGPCSELRTWIKRRQPIGLEMVDAETLEVGSIRRMRYVAGDGSESVEGVRAMGRAMEHMNLGWALCGVALRLPGVWQAVQVAMDASGLGPRTLGSCEVVARASVRVLGSED